MAELTNGGERRSVENSIVVKLHNASAFTLGELCAVCRGSCAKTGPDIGWDAPNARKNKVLIVLARAIAG